MLTKLLRKLFGNRNERILANLSHSVAKINALEPDLQALTDTQLQAKTAEFKHRLQHGETLEQLLPEAFATVREASRRVLHMRPFDVQLIGGMVLHAGKIAEMRTGEGKTLSATLPAYLNALSGAGVHIVTVNDYLAKRDAEWMRPVYQFLGLSVGVIISNLTTLERQQAYAADITYGTNNEFGFDYLRDNMAFSLQEKVQRPLHFAIVDEVDSILIDEARTPLIISGASDDSSVLYQKINTLIPQLVLGTKEKNDGDFYLDEKSRQAHLTEAGHQHIEELLVQANLLEADHSLYSSTNILLMHHVQAAIRAHALFQRNVDYIVQNDQVVIVDEHTGRILPGRRWADGLHQAVEAKENVSIQNENQTLASITFQNYFRLYQKLAGMTGTADTEAYEFQQIYNLEVVVMPTNKPISRNDLTDQIYATQDAKFKAIIAAIKDCRQRQQPVLVGTASIETSEYLAKLLEHEKIPHQVLNAKFHEQEAQIIAEAGRPGNVTIATNMAGRGTDIVLGGNLEAELAALDPESNEAAIAALRQDWQQRHTIVIQNGGLHIIGSERHESRRIDNQLRGRAGRQGDPGSSRFYLSLQDSLVRIFASERMTQFMQKHMQDGEAIEHSMINRAIENAQRKVESRNFDIRKQLLEFDDVANEQRKIIYVQRNELLATDDISETLDRIRADVLAKTLSIYIPPQSLEEQWHIADLEQCLAQDFALTLPLRAWLQADDTLQETALRQRITSEVEKLYEQKEALAGREVLKQVEKSIMLQTLDSLWKEHLATMDHLRQGIHLRGYAQKNPKQEYKRESFELFTHMLEQLKYQVLSMLCKLQIQSADNSQTMQDQQQLTESLEFAQASSNIIDLPLPAGAAEANAAYAQTMTDQPAAFTRANFKVGRNEPCPCGSNKKYKQCHGQIT